MRISFAYKIFSGIVITTLLSLSVVFYFEWQQFLHTPIIPQGKKLVYVFPQGATVKDLAYYLHNNAKLPHPYLFILLAKVDGFSTHLQAGEYELKGGELPRQLLSKIKSGDVIKHEITFVEGWDFKKMLQALNKAPRIKHTINNLSNSEIMQRLGSKYTNPEGLFFPDTYRYTMNTTDLSILQKSYNKMQLVLDKLWPEREAKLPYKNAYQALIAASMIEKEVQVAKERPLVAGVIVNRIRKRMYLQIDPTVIYALGHSFKGKLTTKDMRFKSPYNTYVNKGLPPTPIAMPSEQSLWAALHPAKTKSLYFVARGDGSHSFSTTLKQHDVAIEKYLIKKPYSAN